MNPLPDYWTNIAKQQEAERRLLAVRDVPTEILWEIGKGLRAGKQLTWVNTNE